MKILSLFILISSASFSKPNYDLIARSSVNEGFNIPKNSPLKGISPKINSNGFITYKRPISSLQNTEIIYLGNSEEQLNIFESKEGQYVSNPIFSGDEVLFYTFNVGGVDQVYISKDQKKIIPLFNPSKSKIIEIREIYKFQNHLYFRGSSFDGIWGIYKYDLKKKELKKEFTVGQKFNGKTISYIFSLKMKKHFATCKVRFDSLNEESPELFIRFNFKTNEHKVIAYNKLFRNDSKFTSFRNSAAINSIGNIAFTALSKGRRAIFLNYLKSNSNYKIVDDSNRSIHSFAFFDISLNNSNFITFRAIDSKKRENLFLAKKNETRKILKKFQYIYNEKKEKSVVMHEIETPPFGGSPIINNNNSILLNISVRPLDPYTLKPADIQSAILKISNSELIFD